jgi:hypothetical protein
VLDKAPQGEIQSLQLALDSGRDAIQTGAISSAIGTFARILGSGVTSTEG